MLADVLYNKHLTKAFQDLQAMQRYIKICPVCSGLAGYLPIALIFMELGYLATVLIFLELPNCLLLPPRSPLLLGVAYCSSIFVMFSLLSATESTPKLTSWIMGVILPLISKKE